MKYLVLGGAGFIGTHLTKKLTENKNQVVIIDSCITSKKPNFDVNFIEEDITKMDIEPYVQKSDVIYFLAGSVGVEDIIKNPHVKLLNNINLITKLTPLFQKYNKKVIFSSTSEVYGNGPFSEENSLTIGNTKEVRWSYACSKLISEFMLMTSYIPAVIVRFFNVVGPGQVGNYGMVLPKFVNWAKNNEDIIIYGDGNQIRSFCHVKDAIEMLVQVEKYDREIFNIGVSNPISINELAEKVIKITNSKSKIIHINKNQIENYSDIDYRVPNLNKLKEHIIYKTNYTLDDIIKDML